jgi:putative ABC transport system substrate-binding protein
MKRREFVTLLGGATAWPLASHAQQPSIPVVGYLHAGSLGPTVEQVDRFHRGLQESGYVQDQNVALEYRWAEGHYDRLAKLAADLVKRPVDVLIAGGGPAAIFAAKTATTTIPIVFVSGDDPVKRGLVASLNRPGGNLTGSVFFNTVLVAKRLALLHDLAPNASLAAYLVNPSNPESEDEMQDAQAAAGTLGIGLHVLQARNADEIDATFVKLGELHVQLLVIASDPFLFGRREQVAMLARRAGIPAVGTTREYVTAGVLASYGNSIPEAYHQAGIYAGRILKGAKPADLPVVQSTKFELAINLKTATALGIKVPSSVLALADEIIE